MDKIEGKLVATGQKVGVVVSRFNELVTRQLLEGALDVFVRHGGRLEDVRVVWVPGAFELPLALQKMAASGQYQGLVALGAVIRGGTPHFDYVCGAATNGIAHVMQHSGLPVGFGLLTTENLEQALERSGAKAGNKGAEAMVTVIEMIHVLKALA